MRERPLLRPPAPRSLPTAKRTARRTRCPRTHRRLAQSKEERSQQRGAAPPAPGVARDPGAGPPGRRPVAGRGAGPGAGPGRRGGARPRSAPRCCARLRGCAPRGPARCRSPAGRPDGPLTRRAALGGRRRAERHGLHPEGKGCALRLARGVGQPPAAGRRAVRRGPTASSSQLSSLALIFFLFLWQMHMEETRNVQRAQLLSPPSPLLAPAGEELQTAGSGAEQGCVRNDGHGRRGGLLRGPRSALRSPGLSGPGTAEGRPGRLVGGRAQRSGWKGG